MKYTIARDTNGNRILRITPPQGRGFSIQTNGNLPATHRDGITARTEGEARAYVAEHGTHAQKHAFGLPLEWAGGPEISTHENHNGETYYSKDNGNGETVYSFTKDFEDTWDQETEDFYTPQPATA